MRPCQGEGKLRGKQPKLSPKQQRELVRITGTGEYAIADLAELFIVSGTTVYRTRQRDMATTASLPGSRATSRPCLDGHGQ